LLCLDRRSGAIDHRHFRDIPALLARPSLLVVNNTRVFPARMLGRRSSGGKVELLLLRRIDGGCSPGELAGKETWRCLGKPRRRLRPGTKLDLEGARGLVIEADEEGLIVELESERGLRWALDARGHIPLPPYIRRPDDEEDRLRYQTIFAGKEEGSVAAPTAGLHFTPALMDAIETAGHRVVEVTLHVGLGTFLPVRTERLEDHEMHEEWLHVGPGVVDEIERARADGRPVIAVGTTVVRALESAAVSGRLEPTEGPTSLFILPGYRFRVVEGLVTNFHLPRSTLLALVSALAGRAQVMAAYREAVSREYRFFSYGDAMLIR